MDPKVNYPLVGLFVVVLGAALAAIIVWLSGGTEQQVYKTYVAYMYESVAGLNPRAPLKYRGVDVGQVRQISIDKKNPERVRLLLDIEEGTPVKTDTVAVLSMQGLTGLAFVDLTGGSKNALELQAAPGQRYPEIKVGPSLLLRLQTVVTTGQTELVEVAQELKNVAKRFEALLDEDNQKTIANTLNHIERITGALAAQIDGIDNDLEQVEAILANTARMSQELPALVQHLKNGFAALEGAVGAVNDTTHSFNRLITTTHQDLSRFSQETLAQGGPLLTELRQSSETLRRLTQELERAPNMLLLGRPALPPGPGE